MCQNFSKKITLIPWYETFSNGQFLASGSQTFNKRKCYRNITDSQMMYSSILFWPVISWKQNRNSFLSYFLIAPPSSRKDLRLLKSTCWVCSASRKSCSIILWLSILLFDRNKSVLFFLVSFEHISLTVIYVIH